MNREVFLSLFRESHFITDLKGTEKESILEELLSPLKLNHLLNHPELLLETLKKRETLGSTGIGKQIAIPHCRTLTVSELLIVIGYSKGGIDWQAIDGKPVNLLFLIIAPPQEKQNIYLPVLGKICELARDNKLRKNLLKTDNYQEFIRLIGDAA
jgi:PTS system nitrogen regulatory IIA component